MPERHRSPNIFSPKSIQELDFIMAEHPDVMPFAGGTYIMSRPDCYPVSNQKDLINLSFIPEMYRIQYSDRYIEVGGMITLNQILTNGKSLLPKPFLDQISSIGNSIIKKKATIGGSLCTQDIRFTMPCLLAVMEAQAELRIGTSRHPVSRWIPVSKLYDSPGNFIYQGKAIVTRVRIPSQVESTDQTQLFQVLGSPMTSPDECVIAGIRYTSSQGEIVSPRICFVFPTCGFYMKPETNIMLTTMRLPYSNADSITRIADSIVLQIQDTCPKVTQVQKERVRRLMQTLLYRISTKYLGG